MRTELKPANARARARLRKLQALAERGVDGEKMSALRKIRRLKKMFDFSLPDASETPDLFAGVFRPSLKTKKIYSFETADFDVANSVKWAIESATKIACRHRDRDLVADAAPPTAKKLTKIADHITTSFRTLLDRFKVLNGLNVADRSAFVMGLYDGMMNEARKVGQRLPSRPGVKKGRKGKKQPASLDAGLGVHPYTLALSLGRQIRFSAPLEQIVAELDVVAQKRLAQDSSQPQVS